MGMYIKHVEIVPGIEYPVYVADGPIHSRKGQWHSSRISHKKEVIEIGPDLQIADLEREIEVAVQAAREIVRRPDDASRAA